MRVWVRYDYECIVGVQYEYWYDMIQYCTVRFNSFCIETDWNWYERDALGLDSLYSWNATVSYNRYNNHYKIMKEQTDPLWNISGLSVHQFLLCVVHPHQSVELSIIRMSSHPIRLNTASTRGSIGASDIISFAICSITNVAALSSWNMVPIAPVSWMLRPLARNVNQLSKMTARGRHGIILYLW